MAEAIVFTASTVSSGLMNSTLVTCWLNVNVEFSDTPNNFTASANVTVLPATLTPTGLINLDSRWRVPKITASVLPGFNNNSAFCKNHDDTASEQLTTDDRSPKALGASEK